MDLPEGYDRRLTPARGDVAAAHLRGIIPAGRYVEGQARRVIATRAPVRNAPAAMPGWRPRPCSARR